MPEIFKEIKKLGNISKKKCLMFLIVVLFCLVLDEVNARKAIDKNSKLIEIGYVKNKRYGFHVCMNILIFFLGQDKPGINSKASK